MKKYFKLTKENSSIVGCPCGGFFRAMPLGSASPSGSATRRALMISMLSLCLVIAGSGKVWGASSLPDGWTQLFFQDYEEATATDWTNNTASTLSLETNSIEDALTGKKFAKQVPSGSGNRGAYLDFNKADKLTGVDYWQIEFDACFQQGDVDKRSQSAFAIGSTTSTYGANGLSCTNPFFYMTCDQFTTGSTGTTWYITSANNTTTSVPNNIKLATFTLDPTKWYHFKIYNGFDRVTATITSTDGTNAEIANVTYDCSVDPATLRGLFSCVGRGNGAFSIDNILLGIAPKNPVSRPSAAITAVDGINRIITFTHADNYNIRYSLDGGTNYTEIASGETATISENTTIKYYAVNGDNSSVKITQSFEAGTTVKLNKPTVTPIEYDSENKKYTLSATSTQTDVMFEPEATISYKIGDSEWVQSELVTATIKNVPINTEVKIKAEYTGYESQEIVFNDNMPTLNTVAFYIKSVSGSKYTLTLNADQSDVLGKPIPTVRYYTSADMNDVQTFTASSKDITFDIGTAENLTIYACATATNYQSAAETNILLGSQTWKEVYSQDYEKASATDWVANGNSSVNNGYCTLALDQNSNGNTTKYMKQNVGAGSGNRTAYLDFGLNMNNISYWKVEFDASLQSGAATGGGAQSAFVLGSTTSTYNINSIIVDNPFFYMVNNFSNAGSRIKEWYITSEVPEAGVVVPDNIKLASFNLEYTGIPWYHFSISNNAGMMHAVITASDGNTVADVSYKCSVDASTLRGLMSCVGRGYGYLYIDNITVSRALASVEAPTVEVTAVSGNTRTVKISQPQGYDYYYSTDGGQTWSERVNGSESKTFDISATTTYTVKAEHNTKFSEIGSTEVEAGKTVKLNGVSMSIIDYDPSTQTFTLNLISDQDDVVASPEAVIKWTDGDGETGVTANRTNVSGIHFGDFKAYSSVTGYDNSDEATLALAMPKLNDVSITTNSYDEDAGTYNLTLRSDRYTSTVGSLTYSFSTKPNVAIHYTLDGVAQEVLYNDVTIDVAPCTLKAHAEAAGFTSSGEETWSRGLQFDWTTLWSEDFESVATIDKGAVEYQDDYFVAGSDTLYLARCDTSEVVFNTNFGIQNTGETASTCWLLRSSTQGLMNQTTSTAKFGLKDVKAGQVVRITTSKADKMALITTELADSVPEWNYGQVVYYRVKADGNLGFYIYHTYSSDGASINVYLKKVEVLSNNMPSLLADLIALCKTELSNAKDTKVGDDTFSAAITAAEAKTGNIYQADYDELEAARETFVMANEPKDGTCFDMSFMLADPEVTDSTAWLAAADGKTPITIFEEINTEKGLLYDDAPDAKGMRLKQGVTDPACSDFYNVNILTTSNNGFNKANKTIKTGLYGLSTYTRGSKDDKLQAQVFAMMSKTGAAQYPSHQLVNAQGTDGDQYGWAKTTLDNFVVDGTNVDKLKVGIYSWNLDKCSDGEWAEVDNYHLYYYGNHTSDATAKSAMETLLTNIKQISTDSLSRYPHEGVDDPGNDKQYGLTSSANGIMYMPLSVKQELITATTTTTTTTVREYMDAINTIEVARLNFSTNTTLKHNYLIAWNEASEILEQYSSFSQLDFYKTMKSQVETTHQSEDGVSDAEKCQAWVDFWTDMTAKLQTSITASKSMVVQFANYQKAWLRADSICANGEENGRPKGARYDEFKDYNETDAWLAIYDEWILWDGAEASLDVNVALESYPRLLEALSNFESTYQDIIKYNTSRADMLAYLSGTTTSAYYTEAQAEALQETYKNVNGEARANMQAVYDKYSLAENTPVSTEDFQLATVENQKAIALFLAALEAYDDLAAEVAYCNASVASSLVTERKDEIGMSYADVILPTNTSTKTSVVATLTNTLKAEEDAYVLSTYTISTQSDDSALKTITSLYCKPFDEWTATGFASTSGEHWSGEADTTYFDVNSVASASLELDISNIVVNVQLPDEEQGSVNMPSTLPQGNYALRVACRSSTTFTGKMQVIVTYSDNTIDTVATATPLISKGNTGLGINTSGDFDFNSYDDYANDYEGYGWEYRWLTFSVPENDLTSTPQKLVTGVKLILSGESTSATSDDWISFADYDLRGKIDATNAFTRMVMWNQLLLLYKEAQAAIAAADANGYNLGYHFYENDKDCYNAVMAAMEECRFTTKKYPEIGTDKFYTYDEIEQMLRLLETQGKTHEEACQYIYLFVANLISTFSEYSGNYAYYFPRLPEEGRSYIITQAASNYFLNSSDDNHGIVNEYPRDLKFVKIGNTSYGTYYNIQGTNGQYLSVNNENQVQTTMDVNQAAWFYLKHYTPTNEEKTAQENAGVQNKYYTPYLYKRNSSATAEAGATDEAQRLYLSSANTSIGSFLNFTTEAPSIDVNGSAPVFSHNLWMIDDYAIRKVGDIYYMAGEVPDHAYNAALSGLKYAEVDIQQVDNFGSKTALATDASTGESRNVIIYATPGQVPEQDNIVEVTESDGKNIYRCQMLRIIDDATNDYGYLINYSHEITCDEIIYQRSVKADQDWITLCVPYTVISYDSLQYYKFHSYDETAKQLFFEKVDQLPARTPGLGKRVQNSEEGIYTYFDIGEYTATVSTAKDDVERESGDWSIIGVMKGQVVTESTREDDPYQVYAFWNNPDAGGSGNRDIFKKASKIHMAPYRCYFKHYGAATGSSAAPNTVTIGEWDEANDISEITRDALGRNGIDAIFFGNGELTIEAAHDGDYKVYRVDGALVASKHATAGSAITFHLPSGTYIINGTKIRL